MKISYFDNDWNENYSISSFQLREEHLCLGAYVKHRRGWFSSLQLNYNILCYITSALWVNYSAIALIQKLNLEFELGNNHNPFAQKERDINLCPVEWCLVYWTAKLYKVQLREQICSAPLTGQVAPLTGQSCEKGKLTSKQKPWFFTWVLIFLLVPVVHISSWDKPKPPDF